MALAVSLIGSSNSIFAQEESRPMCHVLKRQLGQKTTVASPAEDNYDVKYVKLDVSVTNTSTYIAGSATTNAVVVAPTMSSYVFELNSLLTIDSILFDGSLATFATTGSLRTVPLPSPLTAGTSFTAQVFYHGTPTSGTIFSAKGINNVTSTRWGRKATFTLSESYRAYEWWPCKQSLRDKIDSADIWLTVPDSLKAGSNGVLEAVTTTAPGFKRYEWKERIPIDYYLLSLSVANYMDYSYYMHYTGSTDSTLVQNYLYNIPAVLTTFQGSIDTTGLSMDFFSKLYGRYPFWQEKYGHCMAPLSGGMEHQTMTTLGFFDGTLVAHELGHQWFGDNVTCGTWADIFINEGFASYSEYLYLDHFEGHTRATNDIVDRQDNVKSEPDGAIFVDDTTNEGRIFDSRLSYDKGACVIHMLRFAINDDTTFFHVLQAHQANYRDSTATIADFKITTVGIAGATVGSMNMDTFFNQWTYGEGYPIYNITWNQIGNDVWVKLDQSTSAPSSVSLFLTPAEITLSSAAGDTTIRIFNNQSSQVYHFTWSKTMTGMGFDKNHWLLYQLTGITRDNSLDINNASIASVAIMPNPTTNNWNISNLPTDAQLTLTDINGRVISRQTSSKNATISSAGLASGMYLLQVVSSGGTASYKLVKE